MSAVESDHDTIVGRCGAHSWLVTRRQSPIIGNQASWENVVRQSDDGGLTWSTPQVIVEATLGGPSERDGAVLSHNAAFHCVEGRLIMYGGRSREKFGVYLSQKHERGIMRWEAIRSPTTKSRWTWLKHSKRLVVRGNHTGCIERRKTIYPMCEFDGRLSVVAASDGSELL